MCYGSMYSTLPNCITLLQFQKTFLFISHLHDARPAIRLTMSMLPRNRKTVVSESKHLI